MSEYKEIIIALIAAISGGGLASFFSFKKALKKHQLLEIKEVLEANRVLREELNERLKKAEDRIEKMMETEIKLRAEIAGLKIKEATFSKYIRDEKNNNN